MDEDYTHEPTIQPYRNLCATCGEPVLTVELPRGRVVQAEPYEWEPRAACYVCQTIAARGQQRRNCQRCDGSGYVGENRPPGKMLAVDIAWSDEGHVRMLAPSSPRRRGEGLYVIHACAVVCAA